MFSDGQTLVVPARAMAWRGAAGGGVENGDGGLKIGNIVDTSARHLTVDDATGRRRRTAHSRPGVSRESPESALCKT
jgi:hypothetical protein